MSGQQPPTRFTVQDIGRYIGEYDHQIQELRLSWSGSQTFLNLDECYSLMDLLNSVLPLRASEQQANQAESEDPQQ
jgi:hypothetical protein